MSEHLLGNLLLAAALVTSVAGMGWLALSMEVHARQVWARMPAPAMLRLLRWLGAAGIGSALGLCLAVDHASMAVLVWVMALTCGALLVAFTLSSRPQRLRWLAPWV